MDNKDLVLEAVKHFGGVWPSDGWGCTKPEKQLIGLCLKDYWVDGGYNKGGLHQIGVGFDPSFWELVCTREEFEARVEALFEGAPEDATYYSAKDGCFIECWLQERESGWWFMPTGFDKWIHLNPQSTIEERTPILRQLKTPKQEKWTPEVGQECEYKTQHQWIKVTIDHIGKKFIVFHGEHDREFSRRIVKAEFRPLQTEAEKERERLFKKVLDAINPDGMTYYDVDTVGDLISELIDKGLIK